MHQKLEIIYQQLATTYPHEPEFLQSAYEILNSLESYINQNPAILEQGVIERLLEPERLIAFRVPWVDDNHRIQVNRGYRVQFNSALGPYKGGLRFHPSVNQSTIKFLGLEQTLKNALTGLLMGGGKGGSDFNPKGKSDQEIMRFCHSYMNELYRHIGSHTDIPAGDIGVSAKEIGYLFGQYKKLTNEFTGVITSKNPLYGGSLARPEATGFGLCYFTQIMLETMKATTLKDKRVIISGSGNVALHALQMCQKLGATVVAMSDSSGYVYAPKGIDYKKMAETKENRHNRISNYVKLDADATFTDNAKKIWTMPCDIAMPCAIQNELDLNDAKILVSNGVIAVSEGANMPCTNEAIDYFVAQQILFGPAKAANAGGVIVSCLEMSQNAQFTKWDFAKVNQKLESNMHAIFKRIHKRAKSLGQPLNLVLGANVEGFDRVAKAMISQGVI